MYFDPYAAGRRIQILRKTHGLTQEEAAIKLNISDRHMRSLEKGTYAPLDLFVEIAVHFDITLDYALRVLAEAWEGDIDSLRSEVLQGVVRFVALYDHEYDPIRLIKQLKRTSPLTIYRSGQAMSGPNYQKYMHQILKAYNGSSRSKSLPIKQ